MKNRFIKLAAWWKSRTLGHRAVLVFLGSLILLFAIYLEKGPKPWKVGLAPREAAEKSVKIAHYAIDGVYYGVVAALVVALLLVLFARFFGRPLTSDFQPDIPSQRSKLERYLLVLVVVVSALLTCRYAIPRFDHSLWFDEELSVRKAIVGDHVRVDERGLADRSGDVKWRGVKWEETLWFFETPNNHMLFSTFARSVHSLWPWEKSPDKPYFSTSALRFAALVPALLTLPTLAALLVLMGMRFAAFALPPLLAVHPWFIRYASEARGYSMAIFFVSLCVLLFWKAAATGKWRWFAAYGLAQFLLLFANLASLWFLVVLNAAAAVALLIRNGSLRDRLTLVGRLAFANTIAAMVTIIMVAPLYLQMRGKYGFGNSNLGPDVLLDIAGAFCAGIRWKPWLTSISPIANFQNLLTEHPLATTAVIAGLVSLALLGLFALLRRGGRHALLVPVIVLPVPVFLLFTYLSNGPLFFFYTVNVLPLAWVAVAVGLGYAAFLIRGNGGPTRYAAVVALILATGAGFWWLGSGQRQMQIDFPLSRALESVQITRDIMDPFAPDHQNVITIGFYQYTRAYDPGMYLVKSGAELRKFLSLADAEGKPLYANFGQPDFVRIHQPDIMELIDNPDLFEEVAVLHAAEELATRWVLKYKPGSIKAHSQSGSAPPPAGPAIPASGFTPGKSEITIRNHGASPSHPFKASR